MIKVGDKIEVRPYKHYKDKPELNKDVGTGNNKFGDYQQVQIRDINQGQNGKVNSGFMYARIYTPIPLKVGDLVTVKKFLYVQKKNNVVTVIGIEIEETSPLIHEIKQEEEQNDVSVNIDTSSIDEKSDFEIEGMDIGF